MFVLVDEDTNLPASFASNDTGESSQSAYREYYVRIIRHSSPPHHDTRTPTRCAILMFGEESHVEVPREINLFSARVIIVVNHVAFADAEIVAEYAQKLHDAMPRGTRTRLILPEAFESVWYEYGLYLPCWHKYTYANVTYDEACGLLSIDP